MGQLNIWLEAIENNQLLGKFKVLRFQYGIIPRLKWPFLLYEFPMTQVEAMKRLCSKFMGNWLGVPPTFSSVNLYSKVSKLHLPVSSLVEKLKATKAIAVSILLLPEDEKVRNAYKTIKCGRKWKPQEVVKEAEVYWKHQDTVGAVFQGWLGLGNYNAKRWIKANALP